MTHHEWEVAWSRLTGDLWSPAWEGPDGYWPPLGPRLDAIERALSGADRWTHTLGRDPIFVDEFVALLWSYGFQVAPRWVSP